MTESRLELLRRLLSLISGLELTDKHAISLVESPPVRGPRISRLQVDWHLRKEKIGFVLSLLLLSLAVGIAGKVILGSYPLPLQGGAGLFLWRTATAFRKYLIK